LHLPTSSEQAFQAKNFSETFTLSTVTTSKMLRVYWYVTLIRELCLTPVTITFIFQQCRDTKYQSCVRSRMSNFLLLTGMLMLSIYFIFLTNTISFYFLCNIVLFFLCNIVCHIYVIVWRGWCGLSLTAAAPRTCASAPCCCSNWPKS